MKKIIRLIPLLLIITVIYFAVRFNVIHYLSFASLKEYHLQLENYVQNNFYPAIIIFSLAYILVTVTSFPGASFFSLLAGFLFGSILGTTIVVIAATIGATLLMLAIKLAFGGVVMAKIGSKIKFMEKNIKHNAFFYLLSLRLLPVVPFWLVNLAGGVLNVKLRDFVITTFIGIIPGAFVYVNIGSSLTTVFAQNTDNFKLSSLVNHNILIALTLLGLISIIPGIVKSLKKGNENV